MFGKKFHFIKILSLAFVVAIACAVFCAGCKKDDSVPDTPDNEGTQTTITLDVSLLDLVQYETAVIKATVSDTSAITFSSDNELIATVDRNGTVTAKNAGSCDITAMANGATAKCKVVVTASPYAAKIYGVGDEIRIVRGASFQAELFADFNGKEVDENVDYSVSLIDHAAEKVAEAEVKDGLLTLKGVKEGITSFSVFAEIRGSFAEKTFTVIVYGSEVVIEPKNESDFERSGGNYLLTLITENGKSGLKNSVNLDFDVQVNGVAENDAQVEFDVNADYNADFDTSKVVVDGNAAEGYTVTAKARGVANLTGKYVANGEISFVKISITVILPERILSQELTIGRENDLFIVPDGLEGKAEEISVGGVTASEKIEGNAVTMNKSMLPDGGSSLISKDAVIYTDKYAYKATANICTKILTQADDFDMFKMVKDAYKAFVGYYMLMGDIDFAEYGTCTAIRDDSNPSNAATGFKGVLDGNGYKIKNITVGVGGIFGHIGSGAVIKNITFDNVHYTCVSNSTLLAHTIRDADLINVTVNVGQYDVKEQVNGYTIKTDVGILSSRFLMESRLKNVTINAQGKEIVNLFGHRCSDTEFDTVTITAASYKTIGYDSDNAGPEHEIKTFPTGVTYIGK